ncbi:Septin and tuftelin-interacting protein 1-like protein [Bienertia sinuspersici]
MEAECWHKGFVESIRKSLTRIQTFTKQEEETSWKWETDNQEDNVLKIDGAWKESRSGEVRVRSRCIQEGASRIFAASPLQAEAYALLEGSANATNHWSTVIIWTDSAKLTHLLHNPDGAPSSCYLLILEILNVLKTFAACRVFKVSRSCVKTAHDLAIQARSGPSV